MTAKARITYFKGRFLEVGGVRADQRDSRKLLTRPTLTARHSARQVGRVDDVLCSRGHRAPFAAVLGLLGRDGRCQRCVKSLVSLRPKRLTSFPMQTTTTLSLSRLQTVRLVVQVLRKPSRAYSVSLNSRLPRSCRFSRELAFSSAHSDLAHAFIARRTCLRLAAASPAPPSSPPSSASSNGSSCSSLWSSASWRSVGGRRRGMQNGSRRRRGRYCNRSNDTSHFPLARSPSCGTA